MPPRNQVKFRLLAAPGQYVAHAVTTSHGRVPSCGTGQGHQWIKGCVIVDGGWSGVHLHVTCRDNFLQCHTETTCLDYAKGLRAERTGL